MGPRDHERAADADREVVAERLREAVTEGRLDLTEFDERLGRTYAAKTYGELDRLVMDLPRSRPTPPPEVDVTPPPRAVQAWLADLWRPWASAVAICIAIWAMTSLMNTDLVYFWPAWVAVPWGTVLACRMIYGLSSGEPQAWAASRARAAGPHRRR